LDSNVSSVGLDGCRAEWGGNIGFVFLSADKISATNCVTDRNIGYGVHVDVAAGTVVRPLVLSGCVFNRDGSDGLSRAGIRVLRCERLLLSNVVVERGVNDDGSGSRSPTYGLDLTNAFVLISGGWIAGVTQAVRSVSGNTIRYSGGSYLLTDSGTVWQPANTS